MHYSQRRRPAFSPAYLVLALLVALALVACDNGNNKATQPTPTANPNRMVTYDLGIPPNALNSPVVGNLPDKTPLHVNVSFKTNQALLNQLGSQKVKTGQSTDLESLANQLGITDQQYQQIKRFFGVKDATLTLGKLHTNLEIDASAGTFASLLHTHFVYHQYNGRKFFAPASPLQMPQSVASMILAITGLDSYSAPPRHHMTTTLPPARTATTRTASDCFSTGANDDPPQKVRSAYGFNQFYRQGWTGKGTTILLVEFAPFLGADVSHYFSCVGYRGKLNVITVDNQPPAIDLNADAEPTLDIEMIAGLAPDANITVYQIANGPDNNFNLMLNKIIQDNTHNQDLKALSISWGGPEDQDTPNDMRALSQDIQILTQAEHITVFAASGDCGAYDEGTYPSRLTVDFPASSPWAIATGGTELYTATSGTRAQETAWSISPDANKNKCQNDWGGGGGLSTVYPRQQWQSGPGVQNRYSTGRRQLPDIAAVADRLPIYYTFLWLDSGGTSAATPIWATAFMLVDQGLAAKTGYFYFGPIAFYDAWHTAGALHPFYDVQQGNDRYYSAAPGWDYCSGLGAPNLVDLYQVLLNGLSA